MRVSLLFALAVALMPAWTLAAAEEPGRPCPEEGTYIVYFDETTGFKGACCRSTECGKSGPDIQAAITKARDSAPQAEWQPKWTTDRFLGSASDKIWVCGKTDKVQITETKRKSRLGSDLTTLISILRKELVSDELTCKHYELKHRRSTLRLSWPNEEKPTHQFSVLTGPREQWALSVNAAVNKIKQLEIKETDGVNSLQLKEEPTRPYLGLDFLTRGDYASDYLNGLVIKLLLEGSSTPTDSFGVALGYRFRGVKSGWFSLDAFSPFVGYLWTNQDGMNPDGTLVEGGDRTGDWVFGVSFNLDKASSWLKF